MNSVCCQVKGAGSCVLITVSTGSLLMGHPVTSIPVGGLPSCAPSCTRGLGLPELPEDCAGSPGEGGRGQQKGLPAREQLPGFPHFQSDPLGQLPWDTEARSRSPSLSGLPHPLPPPSHPLLPSLPCLLLPWHPLAPCLSPSSPLPCLPARLAQHT